MRHHWKNLFWVSVLTVFMLSLVPPSPEISGTGWDKSNHCLAFACLMLLAWMAYPGRNARFFSGLILYGGLIEVAQSLTPYRFAEWGDLAADALGLLIGLAIGKGLERFSFRGVGATK